MNVNNLTTLIISLMVCGLVVGATVPMITAISNETVIVEYNSTDDASWIRMAYGTADYDLEYTLADDTITVGTQSGTADDMILYADEKSCVMSVDGEFVIVNGYIENPEVIKADTVTVTRSADTLTITDGTDTIVSADAPAWAYYPAVDGTYAFFDSSVEGVKVKPNQNLASVGSFAGVTAYNNIVVAPNGAGDLALTENVSITDNVIDSVVWGKYTDTLSMSALVIPPTRATFNDGNWTVNTSNSGAFLSKYNGGEVSSLNLPLTVVDGSTPYNVVGVGWTSAVINNNQLTTGATLVIPENYTKVGYQAFSGCSDFGGTLRLPSTMTELASEGFKGCSGFTGTLILPDNLQTVGYMEFNGCSGFDSLIVCGSPTYDTSSLSMANVKEVLNLGSTELTTTSYGLSADNVRSDVPALGYIAPLSNTVIVQKEGAIFDVLSLLPLVAGIGLLMVAVIYALERRYV